MPWKYIRVVSSVGNSYFFIDEKCFVVCSSILLMMDISSCFLFGTIANKAAVNIQVQDLLSFLSSKDREGERLAPMVDEHLTFDEIIKLPFQVAALDCMSSSPDKHSSSSLSSLVHDGVSLCHGSHLWKGS